MSNESRNEEEQRIITYLVQKNSYMSNECEIIYRPTYRLVLRKYPVL